MSTCLFPGSFDPPTMGHVDLIRRAAKLFDRVIVAVMVNPDKRPMFTAAERVALLGKCVASLPGVEVCAGEGLTLELAREKGADVLLRGLRGEGDAGLEAQLAAANRHVGGIDTLALFTAPEYGYISSSIVRDVLRHGGSPRGLVPPEIESILREKTAAQGR
ncbi:MAG: pantetheine-phosphate adenylyltransferase [Clostridia bacterium]|nr:pantetheine-phosphate adenylyltransferase [Clostridia bacterium]